MSSTIKDLDNYPEINFINNLTVETLMDEMVADFCTKYAEESGTEITLGKADPYRMILYAAALQIYQGMQYIDRAGKQSFLKYAYADFLDNLGALKGVERKSGEGSTAIERFSVSEKRSEAIAIPMGTGVTAGDNVFFIRRRMQRFRRVRSMSTCRLNVQTPERQQMHMRRAI